MPELGIVEPEVSLGGGLCAHRVEKYGGPQHFGFLVVRPNR